MAEIIPVVATNDQKLTVNLAGQQCNITLSQKEDNLYLGLSIGTKSIIQGAVCRDRVRIIRYVYFGFQGDLVFIDTQGTSDPNASALGSRWKLVYIP